MGQLRVHTLKQLVGQLLSGHANAVSVLSFAWNFDNNRQALRQIVLNAMATYYSQNSEDQSRLTRILGIAHELKPNVRTKIFLKIAKNYFTKCIFLGFGRVVQSTTVLVRD